MLFRQKYAWILLLGLFSAVKAYYVEVKGTGSAVVGGTIHFMATLYDDGEVAKNSNYRFVWNDNVYPKPHEAVINTNRPYSNWTVEYPQNLTQPGFYSVTVIVKKDYLVWVSVATNHADFNITDYLGGSMLLVQDGAKRKGEYVATGAPVNHTISLRDNDMDYIRENATSVQTYWFQNCTYLGVSDGLSYEAVYVKEEEIYDVEALVVVSFELIPEPTTTTTTSTTTTTTTTTTTPKPTTTTTTTPQPTTTTTTTPKPTTTTTTASTTTTLKPTEAPTNATRTKRDSAAAEAGKNAGLLGLDATAALQKEVKLSVNSSSAIACRRCPMPMHVQQVAYLVQPSTWSPDPPFNCANNSIIDQDSKKLYGYFKHRVISKAPVTNFTVNGQNWLQHGDLLNLEIKCKGSSSLEYCTLVFDAPYNATGNETCRSFYPLSQCQFSYMRYFSDSKAVLFFIRNDVSETMNQVTVNIYEAKVQSQLSVVVVPVSFTLVAVILVVFGVSYYMQRRDRFNVEVADFNFGETQSVDMEYKTFQQRLIDSICEALPRRGRFSRSNSSDIGPEPDSPGGIDSNLRYNSMS